MTRPIPLFSLVIFPNSEQSTLIKSYKQLLKNHVGWFGSANAAAHITVINFENELSLQLYLDKIREFCKSVVPQKVTLNAWDSFGESTFFITPDKTSQQYLDSLIVDLHQYLGFKIKNVHAHLSIARGLDAKKMKTAYELFRNTPINLQFNCDSFHLRRFNDQTKQYSDIIEKINFGK
ncbi:2'-5' RNA ligase family protein [Flavobacterium limnophilum]|uniref:2'-5' RNA ligase family protein n=1 Tax=Flavobacterium limnophilum TaxID=3003262 RepID=UPI0024827440|nr:2'-5' RNA ligase family protein [Flavobacterium limnophilum]